MNSYDMIEIWMKFQEVFKESPDSKVFDAYIKPIMPLEVTDTYYKVVVKNAFFKQMLEEHYAQKIQAIISSIMGRDVKLIIETMEGSAAPEVSEMPPPPQSPNPNTIKPMKTEQQELFGEKELKEEPLESHLLPKFIFETFIPGNSNAHAYAAAQAVAESPARNYNPLFLYGGVGLGKTHLMHAIGNRIKEKNPQANVLYISSEKFTNEIITSIQNKTTESFRRKYRNIDCLIIDDIQFLKGKEQTQIEFFHTFNELIDADKQIVISSDRTPKEIETLEARLRTRFEQGLMVDLQPPDLETRIAILRSKAAADPKVNIPNEVITLLATNISTNVREIEGAYTKLVSFASLLGIPITIETAQKVLTDMGNTVKKHQITFDDIIMIICQTYNVKKEELFNKKRTQNIAYPRQIAMYLCRELADLSYPHIGELFGGRDHTTVIHAYEKISKNKESDLNLKNELQKMIETLKQ